MIIDGKAIAENIMRSLRERMMTFATPPTLTIISIAPNFATEKYLGIKRRVAESIGVVLCEIKLVPETTSEELISLVQAQSKTSNGIVLQLPYPEHIDIERVLQVLPKGIDVDGIGAEAVDTYSGGEVRIHSPVVSAIAHIAHEYDISCQGKRVVVVGQGRLVGRPASMWAESEGASVVVLTKESGNIREEIAGADIIILGAGVPNLVTPDMVKDGVVIFDAGTSEDSGRLVGDADPLCAEKAFLFTPVPGGIGPVAIAKLFENLLTLHVFDVK